MPRLLYVDNLADTFLSHRLPLARAARANGWQVEVATPESSSCARVRAEGFAHHPIAIDRGGADPRADLATLFALLRLFRARGPDLVHLRTIKPVIWGGIAARLAEVPAVVAHITGLGHAFLAPGARATVVRALLSPLYRLAFAHPRLRVIFQNHDDRAHFAAMGVIAGRRALLVRGSGVDAAAFAAQPAAAGVPLVVFPARLLWDKGVGEFVAAAQTVRRSGVAARFALVGDLDPANPASVSRAQLDAWVADGAVEWWGFRSDMTTVFAQSRIVCMPSHWEGLPKSLLEAASCARAIVTADTPGCREVVRHGDNGLLVPARDAPALAAALNRLIADPSTCRRMGECGRARVLAAFTIERVVKETLAVYRELMVNG